MASDDLSLFNDSLGRAQVDLSNIGFSYDSIANAATWNFSALDPLDAAFYSYQLDATSITYEGLALDGNSDGTGGDDFEAQRYVAILGDASLDGIVNVLGDAFVLVGNLNSTTNLAWADGNFNGDDRVNVLSDAFLLVSNLNRDVRPAITLAASSPAVMTELRPQPTAADNPVAVLTPETSNDDQEKTSAVLKLVTTSPQSATLVLEGDLELRDDVFGNDF